MRFLAPRPANVSPLRPPPHPLHFVCHPMSLSAKSSQAFLELQPPCFYRDRAMQCRASHCPSVLGGVDVHSRVCPDTLDRDVGSGEMTSASTATLCSQTPLDPPGLHALRQSYGCNPHSRHHWGGLEGF